MLESILFTNPYIEEEFKVGFTRRLLVENMPKYLSDRIFSETESEEKTFVLTFEVHITSRGETVEEAIENAIKGGYCLTEDDISSTREVEPENEGE